MFGVFLQIGVILLAILGLIFAIVLCIDIQNKLQLRNDKKKLGKWKSNKQWEEKVYECAVKWIDNPPLVPIKDEERFILLDILRKQYKHESVQNWQLAQLIRGVKKYDESYALSKDSRYYNLKIQEIDEGYLLYQMWSSGLVSLPQIEKQINNVLKVVDKRVRKNGLIEYREGFKNISIVDSAVFICPLLIKYGELKGKDELVELAWYQLDTYYQYAYLPQFGLYAHGYNYETKTPCESIGWGRGTGWYVLGVLYSYNELQDLQKKEILYERMIEAANNIMKFQVDDGGWCTELVGQWNYDSSVTSIFATFLVRIHEITKENKYLDAAKRAMIKLKKMTRQDGAIEFCEGDCHGVGKYSKRYSVSPFTQGMLLELISLLARYDVR